MVKIERIAVCALMVAVAASAPTSARAGGVTNFGDDSRTGWYPNQPTLTASSVASPGFGQIFSTQLEGQIFAQPLVSNGTLLVATEENNVYGLDPVTGRINWRRHLHEPFDATLSPLNCGDLKPHVGITSTPVIDPSGTGTAYLTSKVGAADPVYPNGTWLMHSISLADGSERPGFPVVIGGAADNQPGVTFNGVFELQRPGLLLQDGAVYAAFGGHCDAGVYQGWVFRVTTSGVTTARWSAVPDGTSGGGIWQAGTGLASDGPGTVLLTTGNGFGEAATPHGESIAGSSPPAGLSESVVRLKLQPDGTLTTADFFTPANALDLDRFDADFASGGPIVYPASFGTSRAPRLLGAIGKDGILFTLDRDSLGGFARGSNGSDSVVGTGPQRWGVWGKPSLFGGDGGLVYVTTAGGLDVYRRQVDPAGLPVMSWCTVTQGSILPVGLGSSPAVVTSNGSASGSGLVWSTVMPFRDGSGASLAVFPANPSCGKVYVPLRTWSIGTGTRYAPPGVGAGRIYVGTLEGRLIGFGRPAQTVLSASGTSLGRATVLESATSTIRITSSRNGLRIRSVSTTSGSGFSVDASRLGLPTTLNAGESLDLPITVTAARPGAAGSTLAVETTSGRIQFALGADVLASGPWLSISPLAASFGTVAIGREGRASLTLENRGDSILTVGSLSGLPPDVTLDPGVTFPIRIAAGSSIVVGLRWLPGSPVPISSQLEVTSDGGEADSARKAGLIGSAVQPGHLTLSPASSVAFGSVKVGSRLTKGVILRNTGGATLTLTKYKPPVGGQFSQGGLPAEGQRIAAGKFFIARLTFSPTSVGSATATLYVTADDGTGPRAITLTGRGT